MENFNDFELHGLTFDLTYPGLTEYLIDMLDRRNWIVDVLGARTIPNQLMILSQFENNNFKWN
jgi:hypothetical protein